VHKNLYLTSIKQALKEDLDPDGDITSFNLISSEERAQAYILAKEDGILACSFIVQDILDEASKIIEKFHGSKLKASVKFLVEDASNVKKNEKILEITGSAQLILCSERTILNFLQRLSGVATKTNKLSKLIKNYPSQLLDTRKTMPGLRALEKEAFRQGGGTNHRFNLSDMVLIKENHLAFYKNSNLLDAISELRKKIKAETKIECEVNSDFISKEGNLEKLLDSAVDVIMLDNFNPIELKDLVKQIKELQLKKGNPRDIKLEASGGITEKNIIDYAATGVDFISTGSVTTQATNLDLSMLLEN
jgi:nicotinate-nucleotide pyrophosphorylase (carboxylating)